MAEKLKILCVDDEEDVLFITGLSLELDRDVVAIPAHGGEDALDILKHRDTDVDCILLDMQMHAMSGQELMTAVRTLHRHDQTPIIFLTASVREHEAKDYIALGALGMIAKPFDPLTLAAEVRRMMEDA